MKKLFIILSLILSVAAYSQEQYTYDVDTLATDSVTGKPIIGGIVKLNLEGMFYTVGASGITVYVINKVVAVNAGVISVQLESVNLPKEQYPTLWNYLTSSTVRNGFDTILETYFENNPVDWTRYFNMEE